MKSTQKELISAQRRHETAIARVQAEIKAVETQLASEQSKNLALRDRSTSAEAEMKASAMVRERLEKELKSEKMKCQSLEDAVKDLESQIDNAEELLEERTRELHLMEKDLVKLESHADKVDSSRGRESVNANDNSMSTAQRELKAMSHHRDALVATIDRLEEKVRLLSASAAVATKSGLREDTDSSARQEARLRSRLDALESVVSIYKSGLMALYGNSVSYSYSQYLASIRGFGDDGGNPPSHVTIGTWSGWGQLELTTLRSSFEGELKAADSELIELRGKVRQSQAFSTELSRRFQSLLSQSYSEKGGSQTSASDGREDAFKHLENSTSEALEESARLRSSLHDEKEQSRRRHRQLVEVLNNTISEKEALEAALKAMEMSGVHVPVIVRRTDFRPNTQPNLSMVSAAHGTNTSLSFQSPVKSYRTTSAATGVEHQYQQDEPDEFASAEADFLDAPSSPLASQPAAPINSVSGTNNTSRYNLRTKGTSGRGVLRVRRASAGNKYSGNE